MLIQIFFWQKFFLKQNVLFFKFCVFSAETVLAGTVYERVLLVYLSILRRKVKAKEAKAVVKRAGALNK